MPRAKRGGARQGTPGKGYSNRTDLISNYDQSKDTAAAGGMEAPAGPIVPFSPDDIPGLDTPDPYVRAWAGDDGLTRIELPSGHEAVCLTDYQHVKTLLLDRTASRSLYDDPLITVSGQPETTAARILESYCEAALRHLDSEEPAYAELRVIAAESLELLDQRRSNPVTFAQRVDWAAKHAVIGAYLDQTGDPWQSELARSLDLSYHDLDPNELYEGVVAAGYILGEPDPADVTLRLTHICEPTRALARSVAVTRFAAQLTGVSWGTLEFARGPQTIQVNLPPDAHYSESVADAPDVESFIRSIPESP